jgi:DNA replication protein DnaC
VAKILNQPVKSGSVPALVTPPTEYKCSICHDGGWLYPLNEDGKSWDYSRWIRCSCKKEEDEIHRSERLKKYCKLPSALAERTFENFDTCGDAELEKALSLCRRLVDGDENVTWVTLISEPGHGKSHLAAAACNAWMEKGQAAKFAVVSEILVEMQNSFKLEGEESYRFKLNLYYEVPLLVLDDLGQGKTSDWKREQIFNIINSRYNAKKPLIITSMRELNKLLGDPDKAANHAEADEIELNNMAIKNRIEREAWSHVVVMGGPAYNERKGGK